VDLLSTNIDCDASKGGKVSLKFRHSLTAVVVKTGDDMLPGKVTEVTLSGIYDRGTHSIGTDKWTIDEKTAVKETFTVKPDKTLDASGSGSKPGNTKPGEEIVGGDLTFFPIAHSRRHSQVRPGKPAHEWHIPSTPPESKWCPQ